MDVVQLIRRDHDDLDRIVTAMVAPGVTAAECASLLDALRIGFTTHAAAQRVVLERFLGQNARPALLRMIVTNILDEHREQGRALATIARLRPGSPTWLTCALELRVMMLDHASREELVRSSLTDHVATDTRAKLASSYATERLLGFGFLEPPKRPRSQPPAKLWLFN